MKFNFVSSTAEEEALVKEVLKDKSKFDLIFNKYKPLVTLYIKRRVYTDDLTYDDLVSQVFFKAFKAIDGFRWQGTSIAPWLIRITKNTIIDFFRSSKKPVPASIDELIVHSPEIPHLEALEQEESANMLNEVVKKLPERERKIIYMKFYEGYSNKTIASLEKLSETNVSTIIYRTLKKIKETYSAS